MKGHVSKRGNSWAYWFDIDPDPLTGRQRQQAKSGSAAKRGMERVPQCDGRLRDAGGSFSSARRKVADALDGVADRIEHSIKPSMLRTGGTMLRTTSSLTSASVTSKRSTAASAMRCTRSCLPRGASRRSPPPNREGTGPRAAARSGRSRPALSSLPVRECSVPPPSTRRRPCDRPPIESRKPVGARSRAPKSGRSEKCPPAWNQRRSRTLTGCFIAPGRVHGVGMGQTQRRQ